MTTHIELLHKLESFALSKEENPELLQPSVLNLNHVYKKPICWHSAIISINPHMFQIILASLIENQQHLQSEANIFDSDYQEIEEDLIVKIEPKILTRTIENRKKLRNYVNK